MQKMARLFILGRAASAFGRRKPCASLRICAILWRMQDFARTYAPKYQKAADCLLKERDALLTFLDFPAEHWTHPRTSDEIDKRFLRSRAIFSSRCRPPGEERSLGWKLRQVA
jgi:hypothetical protein